MRKPPDFSLGNWRYEEIYFYYLFNKQLRDKQLSQEELYPLSNKQILEKIKDYESMAHWFRTDYVFQDLDVEDYAIKYKDFRHHAKETVVLGHDFRVFGQSVIKSLHFITPQENLRQNGEEDHGEPGRGVSWFLKDGGIWQEADCGDDCVMNCITSDDTGNKPEKVIITILDLYKYPKGEIEIPFK